MTFEVGHTNHTDTEDHTTDYGTGTAFIIVFLGLLFVGMIVAAPWFLGDSYYTPLYPRKGEQVVVLQRADVPVVRGELVTGDAQKLGAVASPGHTIIAVMDTGIDAPDLSCLKTV